MCAIATMWLSVGIASACVISACLWAKQRITDRMNVFIESEMKKQTADSGEGTTDIAFAATQEAAVIGRRIPRLKAIIAVNALLLIIEVPAGVGTLILCAVGR